MGLAQRSLVVALLLGFAAVDTAAAQANPAWLSWVGCYHVSVQDSSGNVRSYGTYALDTLPAPGQRGRRLQGVIIGGLPQYRTGWSVRAGDTLDLASIWVDGGYAVTLASTGGDSLRGTIAAVGMESTDRTARPAFATKLGKCMTNIPVALAPQLFRSTTDYNTPALTPPPGEPSWLTADSMLVSAPDGRRYVRNALLVDFQSRERLERNAVIQSLGGLVAGSIPASTTSSPLEQWTVVVWVVGGQTLADLTRIAERARWSPAVRSVSIYYRR